MQRMTAAEYLTRTPMCVIFFIPSPKSLRNKRVWLTMAFFKGFQNTVNWLTETALLRRNKRSLYITKALSFWLFFTMFSRHPWYRFLHPKITRFKPRFKYKWLPSQDQRRKKILLPWQKARRSRTSTPCRRWNTPPEYLPEISIDWPRQICS